MFVIKDIINSILKEKFLLEWLYLENNYYKCLGENVVGYILDFVSIKFLRLYINVLVKLVFMVEFLK